MFRRTTEAIMEVNAVMEVKGVAVIKGVVAVIEVGELSQVKGMLADNLIQGVVVVVVEINPYITDK